ncbi:MAG: hypothetical protein HC842_01815 [Cytophagales bacterium]|nr:hypothetical protein [Cytophagales bacterium]
MDGRDYFPLEPGFFRTYRIERIDYFIAEPSDTASYFSKEVVGDYFLSGGDTVYRIWNYQKQEWLSEWVASGIHTVRIKGSEYVETRGTEALVKFNLPLSDGRQWNGRAYTDVEPEIFSYQQVGKPLSFDTLHFPHSVTVMHRNSPDSIVTYEVRWERLAKNVGLVAKESDVLNFCTRTDACLGQLQIETGYRLRQYLISHGYEN